MIKTFIKIYLTFALFLTLSLLLLQYLNSTFKYKTPQYCSSEDCIEDCYCDSPFDGLLYVVAYSYIPILIFVAPFVIFVYSYQKSRKLSL